MKLYHYPIRNDKSVIAICGGKCMELSSSQIKQIRKGNHAVFEQIVNHYHVQVYQLCYRMLGNHHDAQELTQEAFLKAYKNIKSFKSSNKFSPWLFRIATNLCIDYLRKKKPLNILDQSIKDTEDLTMLDQLKSDQDTPEEALVNVEHQEMVQKYLQMLQPKYRSVIVLRYIHDLSLQEISEVLDMPLGTVKTHLHRGRDSLRKIVREVTRS